MDGSIFISYRRDDSAAFAGRIYDRLESHLGSNYIFMDVDKIDYGVDFIDAIEKSVGSCDALIAVIGRNWLSSADKEGRRRLDNPEDFVRIEIATALKRGVRVIPALADGAIMPRSTELPEELRLLARRHALEIRHDRFKDDCKRLIAALERALEPGRVEPRESKEPLERVESTTSKEKPFVNSLGMRFVAVPGTNVLFSVWETRVKEYQVFCDTEGRSWEKPRFPQTDDHPAVNVS
jgi:TIR domain